MNRVGSSYIGLVELRDDDMHSHVYSEPALQAAREEFEARLRKWIRPKDQCRTLKNHRVCVILKDMASAGELELAAAQLHRAFREPHEHLGKPVPLAVSVGFAAFENNNTDMTIPLQQADLALRQAKQTSNLFEIYKPKTVNTAHQEAELIMQIEHGLQRGEFQLYFQPKVHAGFKTLVGAEALVRWHKGFDNVVTPAAFIEAAERNEVNKPLTWWSIKSAISALTRWPDSISVAVNISPNLLLTDDIVSVLRDALDIYEVDPARLTLEVTEKIMIDNQHRMLRQLARIKKMGVRVSLDDFGAGFSSLSYFRDLPVDEIKVDQAFVLNMMSSKRDMAIVKAVIDLAHNFSMKVVAEGVENKDIADKLSEMGCDVLQGYFFDKPLRMDLFETQYRLNL
jgi:EAL domain-containing protein (putative c-di-GMP-specific phosphodiesterase class I)/GGDEF domain-containing protein